MEAPPGPKPSPPDPSKPSPRLPWEIIERVISHSACDSDSRWLPTNPKSTRNFSLACRELRPRSLCLLVADVSFHTRDQIFDFCDFLQGNSYLKPLVRSISVHPDDFAPVPLLHILPNLSLMRFDGSLGEDDRWTKTVFNQSSLRCLQSAGRDIQTLSLSNLQFETWLHFLHILSAVPRAAHLICRDVFFDGEGDAGHLSQATRRLSRRLRLLTLDISYAGRHDLPGPDQDKAPVCRLLLDSRLVQSTLESLTIEVSRISTVTMLPQRFGWPRLRSLTLEMWSPDPEDMEQAIAFLKSFFRVASLKEVIIKVHETAIVSVAKTLTHNVDLCREMQQTMLRFSHPRLVWTMMGPGFTAQKSFWMGQLHKQFPTLFQRDALTVVPDTLTVLHSGHAMGVRVLVISPDSKWAASASSDGKITLWDTTIGATVHLWLSNGRDGNVNSLAFSPNGRYLVSSGHGWNCQVCNPQVWDLGGGLHQVLEGHTGFVVRCAWSPVGDVIATGSQDATVRLWDVNTFQALHVLKHTTGSHVYLAEFSPNGCWLLTGCYYPWSYYIWDVASGMGRQVRKPIGDKYHYIPIAAAFNPTSTRFAIASEYPRGVVEILETDVGEGDSVVLGCGVQGSLGWQTNHIAFSPNGNLVLTVPRSHTMKIWDAHTGVELMSLEGHKEIVEKACFSPCGEYIASASSDCTVRLWRTSDGSCLATLSEHKERVSQVFFSPDGKVLVSGDDDGRVIIRQVYDILPMDGQDP